MEDFTLFSAEPTDAFKNVLQAAGIIVRGWEIPRYRYSKRRTIKNTLKVEGHGWTDPRNTKGNLKLTVDGDRWQAFERVLEIAEAHNLPVANGGMVSSA